MHVRGVGIIVSGGASGLGAATAQHLVRLGARVVILDRSARRGTAVADAIGATFAHADVTNEESVERAVDMAATVAAPLRVVVNCAGGGSPPRAMLDADGEVHDLDGWRATIDLNVTGTFNVTRFAAARVAKNEPDRDGLRGVVINTSSIAASDGSAELIAYSTAKSALDGFTLSAARGYGDLGIRVVTIAPGAFDTPALHALAQSDGSVLRPSSLAPRRLGQPAEFASLVEHVIRNDYLNAVVIRLDGGFRSGT